MVDPLSYFSFQPVLHDWCNKGRAILTVGMVHIKEPLQLIGGVANFLSSYLNSPLPYV